MRYIKVEEYRKFWFLIVNEPVSICMMIEQLHTQRQICQKFEGLIGHPISNLTLKKCIAKGLRFIQLGKRRYFRLSDCQEWLENQSVQRSRTCGLIQKR